MSARPLDGRAWERAIDALTDPSAAGAGADQLDTRALDQLERVVAAVDLAGLSRLDAPPPGLLERIAADARRRLSY